MSENPLGEFLRARRERVDPASVGLRSVGPRRTPGLRREEVATLAGISVEYLVRLERGRDRHPSPAVVDALADVLGLDPSGREHLAALAEVRVASDDAEASPELVDLIESWPQPAIVMDRFLDVSAINAAGRPLHDVLGLAPGDNNVRALFLDPRSPYRYLDFDDVAAETVGNLRSLAGTELAHPRLVALVGELSVRSPLFAQLWASAEVHGKTSGTKRLRFGDVLGEADGDTVLTLQWHTFDVAAAPGRLVVAYQPSAGTGSAAVLERLADRAARRRA